MGCSINLHVYPVASLLKDIEEFVEESGGRREGALPPREFFSKVADQFGEVADGKFYVVWNEYYEDYNPAINFLKIIQEYYFPNQDTDFWADDYETISEGANAHEILSDLFEDEFGYEGKFSDYE